MTAEPSEAVDPSQWVDEYGDYLYRYAFSRLRDANAAEEVVQETFLAGVRYLEQFSGKGSIQGWLTGILKRKIVDFVRARNRHNRTSSWEDGPNLAEQLFDATGGWKSYAFSWSPTPEQKIEMGELWGIVQDCLSRLPKGQADVFMLSVMEELDSDEVCRQLDISPSNFWVRMHRARLGLASCVGTKWNGESQE